MQGHVAAAVLAVIPAAWHVATRPVRLRLADLDRRATMRAAALALGAGVAWRAADTLYLLGDGEPRRFTGSHERGSDVPARMPVTQWLSDGVPDLAPGRWALEVADADGVRRHSLGDLRAAPRVTCRAVLDCTGGWFAAQTWSGVPLAALIAGGAGRRVVVTSHTGFARAFPVEALDHLLLAVDVAGGPLSPGHGAPARLVAPGRRGFWWVKWVRRIHVDDLPPWTQPPFPVQ